MTRYERKLFFEQLVTLRDAYRAEAQAALDLTVEAAMLFAEVTYNAIAAAEMDTEAAHATGGATAAQAD